jgi:hypothetical protein
MIRFRDFCPTRSAKREETPHELPTRRRVGGMVSTRSHAYIYIVGGT